MNKRLLRMTVPAWLKWLTGITCLMTVVLLIAGIYLYSAVQGERTAEFDQIKQKVENETDITNVNRIERFHGRKAYYVIYGETNDQQDAIMFYPFTENNAETKLIKHSEIVPEKTVQKKWRNDCHHCTLFSVKPALITENKLPAWEMTYENEDGRYIMEYVSIYDGELIEMIGFKQKFN
ncbi:hypothetical protein GCM10008983_22270 [Lentibacillus halophilus]|uniref:Cell wall elongation regulator TseB-like domain-containing protein n=1 Tax=Lentibacillus halophilus TaxID=295065 RepID=A0ABN0ZDN7_9BACI